MPSHLWALALFAGLRTDWLFRFDVHIQSSFLLGGICARRHLSEVLAVGQEEVVSQIYFLRNDLCNHVGNGMALRPVMTRKTRCNTSIGDTPQKLRLQGLPARLGPSAVGL